MGDVSDAEKRLYERAKILGSTRSPEDWTREDLQVLDKADQRFYLRVMDIFLQYWHTMLCRDDPVEKLRFNLWLMWFLQEAAETIQYSLAENSILDSIDWNRKDAEKECERKLMVLKSKFPNKPEKLFTHESFTKYIEKKLETAPVHHTHDS